MPELFALLIIGALAYVLFLYVRWAYRDGELRGKSGLLVILLVLTWPGLIAWLVLRPPVRLGNLLNRRSDRPIKGNGDRLVEFAEEQGSLLP